MTPETKQAIDEYVLLYTIYIPLITTHKKTFQTPVLAQNSPDIFFKKNNPEICVSTRLNVYIYIYIGCCVDMKLSPRNNEQKPISNN